MCVECARGSAADLLLADEQFRRQWSELYGQCPWATAFQSPAFALAWYTAYRSRWTPLLLFSRDASGSLDGLLTLAVSSTSDKVVVAGAHQAEYHAWLCRAEACETFPPLAIEALRREIPSAVVDFRYLPPGTPAGWATAAPWARTCLLKAHPRPLMRFGDGQDIKDSLKKGGNKSRLRRLSKLGKVELRRVADAAELDAGLDTVVRYYDARRIAVNGSAPFENDPLKRPFHVAMAAAPGLLHPTLLKAGDEIASAHLNVCWGKQVMLGLIAHNPALGRHSPGKLHILLLAQSLMRDGYEQLDLTPGEESYKSRFANAWDEVYTLTVFPTTGGCRRAAVREGAKAGVKRTLNACGVTPARAEFLLERLTGLHPVRGLAAAVSSGAAWAYSRREHRIYRRAAGDAPVAPAAAPCRRNSVADLLAYRAAPGLPSRREFISFALARMEEGEDLYTVAENGRLLHYAWVAEKPIGDAARSAMGGVEPPGGDQGDAVVLDFFTLPDARRRGLATLCLRTILRDAAHRSGARHVHVAVPADADAARRLVERLGFTHTGSVLERRSLGWMRRWNRVADGSRLSPESGTPSGRHRRVAAAARAQGADAPDEGVAVHRRHADVAHEHVGAVAQQPVDRTPAAPGGEPRGRG
jgi:CelD/BcsL family acetyltransferase involved in cellulose biosynthesis/ribosomal protein S18 acetylase RimI-like enzyme